MTTMVERVARQIRRAHLKSIGFKGGKSYTIEDEIENSWDLWIGEAVGAIEAMREPTEEMLKAGLHESGGLGDRVSAEGCLSIAYTAAIDAALANQQEGEG